MELLEDIEAGERAAGGQCRGKIMGHSLDSAMGKHTAQIIVTLVKQTVYLVILKRACYGSFLMGQSLEFESEIGRHIMAGMHHVATHHIGDEHGHSEIEILDQLCPGRFGRNPGLPAKKKSGESVSMSAGSASRSIEYRMSSPS